MENSTEINQLDAADILHIIPCPLTGMHFLYLKDGRVVEFGPHRGKARSVTYLPLRSELTELEVSGTRNEISFRPVAAVADPGDPKSVLVYCADGIVYRHEPLSAAAHEPIKFLDNIPHAICDFNAL
jgi:hypothetical protein